MAISNLRASRVCLARSEIRSRARSAKALRRPERRVYRLASWGLTRHKISDRARERASLHFILHNSSLSLAAERGAVGCIAWLGLIWRQRRVFRSRLFARQEYLAQEVRVRRHPCKLATPLSPAYRCIFDVTNSRLRAQLQ
jgi:uncharacterized membrane protein